MKSKKKFSNSFSDSFLRSFFRGKMLVEILNKDILLNLV